MNIPGIQVSWELIFCVNLGIAVPNRIIVDYKQTRESWAHLFYKNSRSELFQRQENVKSIHKFKTEKARAKGRLKTQYSAFQEDRPLLQPQARGV